MNAQTLPIRTVDISDYADWERGDISLSLPYAVDGAPYGESLRTAYFATEGEARAHLQALIAMTEGQTYSTSWGEEAAWMDGYRITHYIDSSAQGEDGETHGIAPVSARTVSRGTDWESELLGDAPAGAIASGNAVAGIVADWLADPVTVGASLNTATGFYSVNTPEPRYARTGA